MKKYILGLFTGIIAIPLMEGLLELVMHWLEVAKTKPSGIVMKWNKEMEKQSEVDTCAMGFQVPSEEEYYYEEDEDDDY